MDNGQQTKDASRGFPAGDNGQQTTDNGQEKKLVGRKVGRIAAWVVGTPIALVVLLLVLLYLPPVQRWAVNRAGAWLSEQTGMDVSVGSVGLRFPLNLHIGDVLAIKQPADTVADVGMLDLRVQLAPLFSGQVEVDKVELDDAKINTLDLVEAAHIRGTVGRLSLSSHGIDLTTGVARVNHLLLSDADLSVALADSTAEDTTESQPAAWKILLDDVRLERVRARVALAPQADSTVASAAIGTATLNGSLDLLNSRFVFNDINIRNTAATWDRGNQPAAAQIDFDHLSLTDINIDIPQFTYEGAERRLETSISQFTARERSGLDIQQLTVGLRMDSTRLEADNIVLRTSESDIRLDYAMDLNAFDPENPGKFEVKGTLGIGKGDLALVATESLPEFARTWPSAPLTANLDVQGNLQCLFINRLTAHMPGVLDLQTCGSAENLTDTTGLRTVNLDVKSRMGDLTFVKGFLPAESRNAFNIPRGMTIDAAVGMKNDRATLNLTATAGRSRLRVVGDYGMFDERYDIDLQFDDFNVNQFVPLDEPVNLTGFVKATGKGFDFFSPRTLADATVGLAHANYGQIDASHTDAQLQLRSGNLAATMQVDNEQLLTGFTLKGKLQKAALDAHLDLNLPHADLQAMGLSDERMTVRTRGVFDVNSNLANLFTVDANIDGLDLLFGDDSLHTETFNLHAETQRDTTAATVSTGDLYFDFHAPHNLFAMLQKVEKLSSVAQKQIARRELDVNALKDMLPVTQLKTRAGQANPISKILRLYGISFGELRANLATQPETGLLGDAHIYTLRYDTIAIDTVFLDLQQDSTQFVYHTGVACSDQPMFQGFSAFLDGYIATTSADAHLTFFDKLREKGIDVGLHAVVADSVLQAHLYPDQPILGYRRFQLNEGNYLRLERKNRMFADIHLTSLEDSCRISVEANPADSLMQDIRAVVQKLDLEQVLKVIPGMPHMSGLLNIDLDYEQNDDRFWVNGMSGIDRFAYEGTPVGNVKAVFDYEPVGTLVHNVKTRISHNETQVAYLEGTYNAEPADGFLDANLRLTDLPLSMTAPFIPDQIITLDGTVGGDLTVQGPTTKLDINGELLPSGVRLKSEIYSLNLRFADKPFTIENSQINFNRYNIYSTGENPLTLNGWVDFADTDNISLTLSLYGRNFQLINAPRTRKSMIFGEMYGDFFARVNGTLDNLRVRGLVNVLSNTDMTYVMSETPLSVDYRLDDIVTFVDFTAPPALDENREKRTFMGLDMQVTLQIEDGAEFHCEFSADRQSYVNVQGGGSLVLNQTAEGVMSLIGRYTINEGEMKYTLPVIPLKTFTIEGGSYVEFTGEMMNPTINFAATEETKATVSDAGGQSRSVLFNTGLKITGTLETMELLFTIEAPEDMSVQNELASMSDEEKNKLAVGLLCTGMYLSSSNSSGISANNALNNFLQNEINNIAGKAMQTVVDVNVGMEQNTRDDGTTRTDYAFKFSKRFFSNRLNVVVGGKVNADGNTQARESGTYIDNVSLEWRLDNGGNRYVRLYHEKNYDNLLEGELVENGASVVLRKKFDKLSDLIIWKKKE